MMIALVSSGILNDVVVIIVIRITGTRAKAATLAYGGKGRHTTVQTAWRANNAEEHQVDNTWVIT